LPNPQKAKGSSWERDVARFLTDLYKETFIRAPGSGAYVGGTNTKRKQMLHEGQIRSFKGDIVPGQSFPKFNAECKSYKDFPFHQLYSNDCKQLEDWLDQLIQASDTGDFNILIMKFNRKGKYVAVQHHWAQHTGTNYTIYHSKKLGTWYIQDYDTFWQSNADNVKLASA